eukprot:97275-Rhodomonas_salina.1
MTGTVADPSTKHMVPASVSVQNNWYCRRPPYKHMESREVPTTVLQRKYPSQYRTGHNRRVGDTYFSTTSTAHAQAPVGSQYRTGHSRRVHCIL